ncbi:MAG TPA: hypothetical protein DF984_04230 [Anaerolineaceae bacterium]|jgi:metal-sulfur cluster biosynthetic enzyme|nr:hypothetical protein [Anaerolineaceae bacterium]
MNGSEQLKTDIFQALTAVIDPETGADVLRMRIVADLTVDEAGLVTYLFRPSSPLCPIALPLVISVIEALKAVPGVKDQQVTVVDYVGADELNAILRSLPLSSEDKPKS